MILTFRHTALAALAALAAMLGACSEATDAPQDEPDEVLLRITVNHGLSVASRADKGPEGFEGTPDDLNFEKISTLRIIIVDEFNRNDSTGTVEANRLVSTTAEGYPINDNLVFRVKTGSKRIYLIANEGSLPSPVSTYRTSAEYLDSYREGYLNSFRSLGRWVVTFPGTNPKPTGGLYSNTSGVTGLPLTEYFDVVLENLPPEQRNNLRIENIETQSVHLFLTRAAAKVTYRIFVDETYKGATNLTAISLSGLNWAQYVFPHKTTYYPEKADPMVATFGPSEAIPDVTNRFITSFSTPDRINGITGVQITTTLPQPVKLTAGADGSKPIYTSDPVYFPESLFPAQATPTNRFNVNVSLDGEELTAKPLVDNIMSVPVMVNGQNTTRNGIARDTHLQVNIYFSEVSVTWQAVVAPYNELSLYPEFGL